MEGNGTFYKQPRTEIRPRPSRSFDGRVYAVASSDDSVVSAAKLNARLVMFADRPWPMRMPAIQKHRDLVRQMHGVDAEPPLLADFCVCTPTMDGAKEKARQYMGKFVESNFYHYELLGEHFGTVKGYDAYAQKIAMAKEIGMDGIVSAFMEAAVWGPPDRILRMFEERRSIVGEFELATSFRFGGTPYDLAESGLRLYAKEVLPVVRSWKQEVTAPTCRRRGKLAELSACRAGRAALGVSHTASSGRGRPPRYPDAAGRLVARATGTSSPSRSIFAELTESTGSDFKATVALAFDAMIARAAACTFRLTAPAGWRGDCRPPPMDAGPSGPHAPENWRPGGT